MSLTKETFEEAQKNARERISEWVTATKTAGIARLQDRYDDTFTRIAFHKKKTQKGKVKPAKVPESEKKQEEPEIKLKTILKGGHSTKEEKIAEGIPDIPEYGHTTPERTFSRQTHGRRSRNKSRCRSRARSRQTSGRCLSSHHTSGRRTDSRRKFRDSASMIFGDNRNNRSSRFTSECSLDAISLLPEGYSEICPEKTLTIASKSTKGKQRGSKKRTKKINKKVNILNLESPEEVQLAPDKKTSSQFSKEQRRRSENRKKSLGIFPSNFKKRRRTRTEDLTEVYEDDVFTIFIPSSDDTSSSSRVKITESTTPFRPASNITVPTIPRPQTSLRIRPATRATSSQNIDKLLSLKEPGTRNAPSGTLLSLKEPGTRNAPSGTLLALKEPGLRNVPSGTLFRALSGIRSSMNARRVKSGRFRLKGQSPPSDKARKNAGSKGSKESKVTTPDLELIEKRKKAAIRKFKLLVRKIMCVLAILKTSVKNVRKNMEADKKKARKKNKMLMTFDPSYFSSATTYGDLSVRSRVALEKQPQHRTPEDIKILTEVMYRLPLFAKYSHQVKSDLARIVWYDCYEKGRIIIRQGDVGNRMYFIVSGTVSIHRTDTDPKTDEKILQHVRDVHEGSTFGELALIRNMSRTYTAICKGISEFLSLGKEEFNAVLRNKWEESWNDRISFLQKSRHFENWSEEQRKQTADVSYFKEYSPNRVIFGDETRVTDYVYFITKGRCFIVRKLRLIHADSPCKRRALYGLDEGFDRSAFLDKPYGKKKRKSNINKHFLTVMALQPGDFFGVGENMKDSYVISKTKVECLLINAASYSIHSKREELNKMMAIRDNALPSQKELHQQFEVNRRWNEYKQEIVREVVSHKAIPNSTSYSDVPVTITFEPGIPYELLQ